MPTLFDRLQGAGDSWKIYGGTGGPPSPASRAYTKPAGQAGYGWTICPTFFECLSSQRSHLVPANAVLADGAAGHLPAYSIVTPVGANSQHNGYFMSMGDNWIGQVVSAIELGPQWKSTAIFITYDDCGCFYDHVNPLQYNPNWGIRVPLVIVSPYARRGYTDSFPTTFMGILAFVEHTFRLRSLTTGDAGAYGFWGAFDFSQRPLKPVATTMEAIPGWKVKRALAVVEAGAT